MAVQYLMLPSEHDIEMRNIAFLDSLSKNASNSWTAYILSELPDYIAESERRKRIEIGNTAPNFQLTTHEGKFLALNDWRGKYVLLDFWASWCPPCRNVNPKLRELYAKYKKHNFDILSISIDKNREDWLKAIKQDQMVWSHMIDKNSQDPENVALLYNIHSIPNTLLLDPEGKIIAKDLSVEDLDQTLKAIFETRL
ncbi:MAG: TlpA family protein disulfide reductase [Bernardetiaceae bacterium]|nr:TlpA family protein disulfide reductase [Bernardetiaceae bacterium]